ncbi:hypothetical protein CCR97_28705 [Rhodoplanes elegans]|uniref:Uncharacterized protein n=1 Tax=Rhodoplanes elegans TaxID=29408 RepID=A0A327KMQ4_9BRAD|nr:hypothetical protein [Rhodoplanes elegans]RAI40119.1 hypothetical protein CH338_07265 [Rhodoplanes elegans]
MLDRTTVQEFPDELIRSFSADIAPHAAHPREGGDPGAARRVVAERWIAGSSPAMTSEDAAMPARFASAT